MWELVATAAAALNGGAGLQAAIAGGPAPGDVAFARFAGRSRLINLLLTTISTAAAAATFYDAAEKRGNLWLYAGLATFLGIPFNLLMMAPPTPVLQPPATLVEPPGYARRSPPMKGVSSTEQLRREAEAYGSEHEMIPDEAGSGAGSAFAQQLAAGEGGGYGYGEEAAGYDGGGAYSPRRPASPMAEPGVRRRLMYAKSGMLVSPTTYASSWTRKFWFSACLSCLSCGVMMALLASRKDAATYTDTPF